MKDMSMENFNKTYKSDIRYAINTCRWIALFLGLWPNNNEKFLKKLLKIFINFLSITLMIFVIVSCILFGIFELNEISQKISLTGPTSFYIMAFMKYSIILIHSQNLENCFQFMEIDWQYLKNNEHRKVMLKYAKLGRSMTILCATFMYTGGFWFHILSPLTAGAIVTHKNISCQPFPLPIYGNYLTTGESPIYEIIYFTHIIVVCIMESIAVVTFSFAAILTIHACGQFEIVIIYLNDLVSELEKEKIFHLNDKLIITVNSHLRVLSFVSQLESVFNEICFIEIMGSTLNICLLGYYTIRGWKNDEELATIISYTIILASFIFNIFIYCLIGEMVTMQARKVGEKSYMIEWYLLPRTTSKDLLFFIIISQFPPKISVGKIFVLSFETFSAILKTSAAYLNALWKMSHVTPVAFSFVAMFTLHACSQFEIVIFYLNKLLNKVDNEKCTIHEKFVIIVNSHHRVISFVAKLEAAFTEICLIEISICTVALCLIGYYMIMNWKENNFANVVTYIILLNVYIFNIFIYSYIGELLTTQARKVGETCYMIDWHQLPKNISQDLSFLIQIGQLPK
ncbi:odorant receptor 22c-like [Leptopilina boulardi]|uniref:odorant receptor 22c-like n=1 Tax=Leptopilina boulardi TaxID=63433 RepID=UPI0021F62DC7|nr:odorant receptor 22c-like [Leptopilina boulardi]